MNWPVDCLQHLPSDGGTLQTALIVDRDLGFVFWLARRLNQLGHQAFPALGVAHAALLAEQFPCNLLVIDASLPGSAAFIESLQRSHRHLKVLALAGNDDARFEQVRRLEMALHGSLARPGAASNHSRDQPELPSNRLAASRAALTGALLGAALWAVLIGLVIPR